MTTSSARSGEVQRISGPDELLQAVPYLLGFHPAESLVLVGLRQGRLVVTARFDLDDARGSGVVVDTVRAMRAGGSTELIGAVYSALELDAHIGPALDTCAAADSAREAAAGSGRHAAGGAGPAARGAVPLPWADVAAAVDDTAVREDCRLIDVLLVRGARWWSYTCTIEQCCPAAGRCLPQAPSAFAAEATVAGVVALPDREALAAQLDPLSDAQRRSLGTFIAAAEHEIVAAVIAGSGDRRDRSLKRAIFAAARGCVEQGWVPPPPAALARFAVAMSSIAFRDAIWMAIDDGRFDGRPLMREIARRCPSPYDAGPLFLFGWASWRAGQGALAGIAAERAIGSDPGYTAADLLLAALGQGVDPRTFPRLRPPRR